jgi:hypothetical protein
MIPLSPAIPRIANNKRKNPAENGAQAAFDAVVTAGEAG